MNNTIKKNKKRRPPINPKTKLKLWVDSGGRCQFPGCNEYLLTDNTTLAKGNFSNIAHIISWVPTGPRGSNELSSKLATDISNLMLMCKTHSGLIDDVDHIPFYTIEKLKGFKEDHENRIKNQTGISPELSTNAIRFKMNIRGRPVSVTAAEIHQTLMKHNRYPKDMKGICIDLTNIEYDNSKSYWKSCTNQIDGVVSKSLHVGNDGKTIDHFSVFALAPIPLLVHLGFRIGNAIPADIYIKPREKSWQLPSITEKNLFFKVDKPRSKTLAKDIALVIDISGVILKEEIEEHLGQNPLVYKISVEKPGIDQIECLQHIENFRKAYRDTLTEITNRFGKKVKIHLFSAIPACIAVVCGREVLHGVDPSILVYEHVHDQTGFVKALKIN